MKLTHQLFLACHSRLWLLSKLIPFSYSLFPVDSLFALVQNDSHSYTLETLWASTPCSIPSDTLWNETFRPGVQLVSTNDLEVLDF